MSDYLYSSSQNKAAELTSSIQKIYENYDVLCQEFEGEWGSLSVSMSPYKGLQPLATETHICVVLGGPVLYFRDNNFLTGNDATEGTRALLERYLAGDLDLEHDVSGPFQLVIIDKTTQRVTCITDLMLFIPAYICKQDSTISLGSHVDAVARIAGLNNQNLDETSLADFILHGVVTYPYTVYKSVSQLSPATFHHYDFKGGLTDSVSAPYWLPHETYQYKTVQEAASALRQGLETHINAITKPMTKVAQFISGGEDSRVLSGLLSPHLKRDAFVFLDRMNREGRIAQKIANVYGASFHLGKRDPLHYLHVMDEASALVGSGHEHVHCHSLRFDKEFKLNDYSAVFGGYISDTLLKGMCVPKTKLSVKFPFLPEKCVKGYAHLRPLSDERFNGKVLLKLSQRRAAHLEKIKEFRSDSAQEWCYIWPATVRDQIPNHYCNRRLFASYEVFMSHEALKVGASVPTEWKLNRKLFHSAFQPFLEKSKWIRHSDRRLPYFNAWVNRPILFLDVADKGLKKVLRSLKLIKNTNEGPWSSWAHVQRSEEWKGLVEQGYKELKPYRILCENTKLEPSKRIARNFVFISQRLRRLK